MEEEAKLIARYKKETRKQRRAVVIYTCHTWHPAFSLTVTPIDLPNALDTASPTAYIPCSRKSRAPGCLCYIPDQKIPNPQIRCRKSHPWCVARSYHHPPNCWPASVASHELSLGSVELRTPQLNILIPEKFLSKISRSTDFISFA